MIARYRPFAAFICAASLAGCVSSGRAPIPAAAVPDVPAGAAAAQTLYAYSPGTQHGLVASYPANADGNVSPQALLSGSKTGLAGGTGYYFGGGVEIGSDGTLYVFDGMEGVLRTYAPGTSGAVASGDVAPKHVEILPENGNKKLKVPEYAGFAQDTKGNFWTVDRSDAKLLKFPLGHEGKVQPLDTLVPLFTAPHNRLGPGSAAGVADDGNGNIYCSCQAHDLALQAYGITVYDMTGKHPKFVRTSYGIVGNLDTQIPTAVIHVDPVQKLVYIGLYKPAFVAAYPITASGQAPAPRIIGGVATTLNSVVQAITTDAKGYVYVAINDSVVVFGPKASGNVKPVRVVNDAKHLVYADYTFGNMLVVR